MDLEKRSLIFVLAHNHTEFVTNYIGFFKKGLVQVLLNANIDINLLKNFGNLNIQNRFLLEGIVLEMP